MTRNGKIFILLSKLECTFRDKYQCWVPDCSLQEKFCLKFKPSCTCARWEQLHSQIHQNALFYRVWIGAYKLVSHTDEHNFFFNLHSFSSYKNYHSLLSSLNSCLICNLEAKACTNKFGKVIAISHMKFLLISFFPFLFLAFISFHFSSWSTWLNSMCPYCVENIYIYIYIKMCKYVCI